MKHCKLCQAEMDDLETVCPQCGDGLKEQAERKAIAKAAAAALTPAADMADLAHKWKDMTPVARRRAIKARTKGVNQSLSNRLFGSFDWFGGSREPSAPSPQRVASRALVLAAVISRAVLERPADFNADPRGLIDPPMPWLKSLRCDTELEPAEREFLNAPVGAASPAFVDAAIARAEGLAVLAWALGRFEMPAFDMNVDTGSVLSRVGVGIARLAGDVLRSAKLRSTEEIDLYATQATLISWRLRTFQLYPGRWDFSNELRKQPAFTNTWLGGLPLEDGDLMLDKKPIANASIEKVERCLQRASERQLAAYWLQGDDSVYSKVDPVTLLTTC